MHILLKLEIFIMCIGLNWSFIVLAALLLPKYYIAREERTITGPCAQEVGPRFRCINPKNCGPAQMKDLRETVICGPGGVGICCPVISFHSPARCGIRTPYMLKQSSTSTSMRYPNLKGRRQIQFVRNPQGQKTLTGFDNYENDSVVEKAEVHQHPILPMNQMNEPVMHQSDLHEVHYETPMISILSRNISVYKTDYRSMRMRRSLDDKHDINASESLQQNDLKQNKSLEVKTNSPYPIVYEYEYMVDKIETLIKRIGGMKVICKDYPELAYILTMELNKTCPSSVISLNITNFIDSNTEWPSTTDVGEHLEMKQDSNSTINMRKRRNSESNDWKDLYFLSREYLREILEMLVSEKYGDSVSKDSISKINLHRPFSSEELKLLLLGDFTSGVKNLTFEAYMKNIDQYLGSRKLSVSSSHSSKESNLTQSMNNSSSGSSKTVKGSAGIHSEHADESKFSEEIVHFRGSLKNENKENHLEHDSQNAPNHNCDCHMEDVVKEKQTAKNISHSSNSDNKTGETVLKYRNKQEDFKMDTKLEEDTIQQANLKEKAAIEMVVRFRNERNETNSGNYTLDDILKSNNSDDESDKILIHQRNEKEDMKNKTESDKSLTHLKDRTAEIFNLNGTERVDLNSNEKVEETTLQKINKSSALSFRHTNKTTHLTKNEKRIEGEYRSMKASHNRNVETEHEGPITEEKETEKNVSHSFNSNDRAVESDSDKRKELEDSLYSVIVPNKNRELPHIPVTREIEEEEIVDYVFHSHNLSDEAVKSSVHTRNDAEKRKEIFEEKFHQLNFTSTEEPLDNNETIPLTNGKQIKETINFKFFDVNNETSAHMRINIEKHEELSEDVLKSMHNQTSVHLRSDMEKHKELSEDVLKSMNNRTSVHLKSDMEKHKELSEDVLKSMNNRTSVHLRSDMEKHKELSEDVLKSMNNRTSIHLRSDMEKHKELSEDVLKSMNNRTSVHLRSDMEKHKELSEDVLKSMNNRTSVHLRSDLENHKELSEDVLKSMNNRTSVHLRSDMENHKELSEDVLKSMNNRTSVHLRSDMEKYKELSEDVLKSMNNQTSVHLRSDMEKYKELSEDVLKSMNNRTSVHLRSDMEKYKELSEDVLKSLNNRMSVHLRSNTEKHKGLLEDVFHNQTLIHLKSGIEKYKEHTGYAIKPTEFAISNTENPVIELVKENIKESVIHSLIDDAKTLKKDSFVLNVNDKIIEGINQFANFKDRASQIVLELGNKKTDPNADKEERGVEYHLTDSKKDSEKFKIHDRNDTTDLRSSKQLKEDTEYAERNERIESAESRHTGVHNEFQESRESVYLQNNKTKNTDSEKSDQKISSLSQIELKDIPSLHFKSNTEIKSKISSDAQNVHEKVQKFEEANSHFHGNVKGILEIISHQHEPTDVSNKSISDLSELRSIETSKESQAKIEEQEEGDDSIHQMFQEGKRMLGHSILEMNNNPSKHIPSKIKATGFLNFKSSADNVPSHSFLSKKPEESDTLISHGLSAIKFKSGPFVLPRVRSRVNFYSNQNKGRENPILPNLQRSFKSGIGFRSDSGMGWKLRVKRHKGLKHYPTHKSLVHQNLENKSRDQYYIEDTTIQDFWNIPNQQENTELIPRDNFKTDKSPMRLLPGDQLQKNSVTVVNSPDASEQESGESLSRKKYFDTKHFSIARLSRNRPKHHNQKVAHPFNKLQNVPNKHVNEEATVTLSYNSEFMSETPNNHQPATSIKLKNIKNISNKRKNTKIHRRTALDRSDNTQKKHRKNSKHQKRIISGSHQKRIISEPHQKRNTKLQNLKIEPQSHNYPKLYHRRAFKANNRNDVSTPRNKTLPRQTWNASTGMKNSTGLSNNRTFMHATSKNIEKQIIAKKNNKATLDETTASTELKNSHGRKIQRSQSRKSSSKRKSNVENRSINNRRNKKHNKENSETDHRNPKHKTTSQKPKHKAVNQMSKHQLSRKRLQRHHRDVRSLMTSITPLEFRDDANTGLENATSRKTLNLKIAYGKEVTFYQPRDTNPFADYGVPPEEDEFEKIVHDGYKKHLFNRGKFSVAQLNKNFKVYKPEEKESSEDEVIGYRNGTSSQRQYIIGGRNVDTPWPWMVGIYEYPSMKFVCGGTLFDSQNILSAAHCFAKYAFLPRFAVVVGSLYRYDRTPEPHSDKVYQVKKVFLHKGFSMDCYCNDIAVLRLAEPLGPDHMPECIAHFDPAGVGENVTVLGWGDTAFHSNKEKSGMGTDILQRGDGLTIFPPKECRDIMSKIAGKQLPDNFGDYYICAGVPDGSRDACIGDSGGPLLHEDYDGMWSLVGVVSFGYKCAEPGVPGTYSRISYYIPWITKTLETP